MTVEEKRGFLINSAFIIVIAAILYFIFRFCLIYLLPFVIGLFLAVIVQKPANHISKKTKIKKSAMSVILVVILYLLTIALIGTVCIFAYSKLVKIITKTPDYIPYLTGLFDGVTTKLSSSVKDLPDGVIKAISDMPANILTRLTDSATKLLSSTASNVAKSAPGLLVSIIVTVVASCYIAKDYDLVMRFVHRHLSPKSNKIISDIKMVFFNSILKLAKGYLLLMIITFAELSVGLVIIGVTNPVGIAAIIAVVDILPVLGTGVVVIPWAIISLLSGNIWRAVGFALLYLIITIMRNFLEPKVIGDQVGLHPLITLLSMFIGLRLFGFIGIFALPITIIIIAQLQKNKTIDLFGISSIQKEREQNKKE